MQALCSERLGSGATCRAVSVFAPCIPSRPSFDSRYSTKGTSDRKRADKAPIGSFGKRLTYRRTACARRLTISSLRLT